MVEKNVKLRLLRAVEKYGERQDVGKEFELPEKEAAALVGMDAAEYVGKPPNTAEANSTEAVVKTRTRKKGARNRGTAPVEAHPEVSG